MVREPDTTMQPAPQHNQLMSKHCVLSFKPQLQLEWRGQDGQNETEQARSFRQLRRFHHVINSDKVFGTHRLAIAIPTKRNSVMIPIAQKAAKCRKGF
jgi:hypothetical protein